jgi:hypothetical protein
MRDLIRARMAAVRSLRQARQQLSPHSVTSRYLHAPQPGAATQSGHFRSTGDQ